MIDYVLAGGGHFWAQGAGLPFGGNLPFLVDGDTKLVQSNTILRHIGRKYNLMGDGSAAQDSAIDLLLDQISRTRTEPPR